MMLANNTARNEWRVDAYYAFGAHRSRQVLQNDELYWNGRFLEEQMWISFDLGQTYTISGMRI